MPKRRPTESPLRREGYSTQAGLGTFALIGILVGIGIVFLVVFLIGTNTTKKPTDTQTNTNGTATTPASNEPPFIRIPENSTTYNSSTYRFSFAYPSSFEKLTETSKTGSSLGFVFQAESAPAVKKPVGNAGAILSGPLGAYVYKKDDFKMLIGDPDIYVAPAKTGNGITWKIVSKGNTTQDIKVGDAYPAKSTKSQTGITVFDFTLDKGTSRYGRYVFEAGDYYVIIALPNVSLPSGAKLSDSDLAAYKVIGINLASTVRTQATASSTGTDSGSSNGTDSSTSTTNSTTNKPE